MKVRAKKHLGQHFLKDDNICQKIADAIPQNIVSQVLEVGPGTGALTRFLLDRQDFTTHVIDVDEESIEYLKLNFEKLNQRLYFADFLKIDLNELMGAEAFIVAGNFPYNISTEILFRILNYKDQVPVVVGMFQKEVAERVAEKPGSKRYGITSVLLQAYYNVEYLFTVNEDVFDPPPKVKSGVIRLTRNERAALPCDEKLFTRVVKTSFNQRRKTLRNSLKALLIEADKLDIIDPEFLMKRPETLSVDDFIDLTQQLEVKN